MKKSWKYMLLVFGTGIISSGIWGFFLKNSYKENSFIKKENLELKTEYISTLKKYYDYKLKTDIEMINMANSFFSNLSVLHKGYIKLRLENDTLAAENDTLMEEYKILGEKYKENMIYTQDVLKELKSVKFQRDFYKGAAVYLDSFIMKQNPTSPLLEDELLK